LKCAERIANLDVSLNGSKIAALGRGKIFKKTPQVLRQRRAGFDPLAGSRMRKSEFCGMEKLPTERRKLGFADAKLWSSAIESVSDERMLYCGEVHSDLMRSAGVQLDLD